MKNLWNLKLTSWLAALLFDIIFEIFMVNQECLLCCWVGWLYSAFGILTTCVQLVTFFTPQHQVQTNDHNHCAYDAEKGAYVMWVYKFLDNSFIYNSHFLTILNVDCFTFLLLRNGLVPAQMKFLTQDKVC